MENNVIEVTAQSLHEKIAVLLRLKGELIYGDVHVLNISEEEEVDKFDDVHYRVYSNKGFVFDVIRRYNADEYSGAGEYVYEFIPQSWDGFESIKPLSLEEAREVIQPLFKKGKLFHYYQTQRSK